MDEQETTRGELYFLWHHGTEFIFSGFGLMAEADRPDLLVGLLMVDRPHPVLPAWLARVEETFGEYTLYPMTATHEHGLACQMVVEAQSLPYLRKLEVPQAQQLRDALSPLLVQRPKPRLRMHWDETYHLWLSQIMTDEVSGSTPPLIHPLFPLGDIVATPGALAAILEANQTPFEFLVRHVTGDWGDLCAEDKLANLQALRHGGRLFSAYHTQTGVKLYVITEWDYSVTTLLLPSEY